MSDSGRITLEDSEQETRIRLELPSTGPGHLWSRCRGSRFCHRRPQQSEGVLYATFVGPQDEEDSGWFNWLWGSETTTHGGHHYQIHLDAAGDNVS